MLATESAGEERPRVCLHQRADNFLSACETLLQINSHQEPALTGDGGRSDRMDAEIRSKRRFPLWRRRRWSIR